LTLLTAFQKQPELKVTQFFITLGKQWDKHRLLQMGNRLLDLQLRNDGALPSAACSIRCADQAYCLGRCR
jgi:hypothetical protein